MNLKLLLLIHQGQVDREYIAVDTETNIPYHIWEDGGNMFGGHTMEITWQDVAQMNAGRLRGINETNWRDYLK